MKACVDAQPKACVDPQAFQLLTLEDNAVKETLKTLAKENKLNLKNKGLLCPTGSSLEDGKKQGSPRSKPLLPSNRSPCSPTGPAPETLDKAHSRSLEVLSVEEEQLSDDDDDDDSLWGTQSSATRV